MVNATPEESARWENELRLGMHRSIAFYRGKLGEGELNQMDRSGLGDLLDLLEDFMRLRWPVVNEVMTQRD
jgi:hypothetical protein